MEFAGLALTAVAAAPVFAEYGYRIYRRVQDKRRLASLAQELSVFALNGRKNQLTLLIELAQPVLKNRTIVPEHQERLLRTWERLKEQLGRVDQLMDPNEADPGDYYTKFPNKNKAILLSMSEGLVPTEAGTKMSRMVCEFLTCLDRKGQELDEEPNEYVVNDEADRIKVAMNFVDTALKDLRNIQASI
ncbi:hypothetical protein CEP53_012886 [Fusarium sp. AF-6]|nr:hypothetical protein CEP53_012886 [Fusarium sp. AF-6]